MIKEEIEARIQQARVEVESFAKGKSTEQLIDAMHEQKLQLLAEQEKARAAECDSDAWQKIAFAAKSQLESAGIKLNNDVASEQSKRMKDIEQSLLAALAMLTSRAMNQSANDARVEALAPQKAILSSGRTAGAQATKDKSANRKARIEGEVKRLLNNPAKEIGFNLPIAAYAEPDDFVIAIKRAGFNAGLKDGGVKRIVSPVLTAYKKAAR